MQRRGLVAGMASNRGRQEVEELGSLFGANLRLTDKEQNGIAIDKKATGGVLLGFQYTMVTEVLTSKDVHGEAFIDCFTSLCRGRNGVSICDIGDRRFFTSLLGNRIWK